MGRRAVGVVFDHPQPGPEFEVEFETLGVFLHQPGGGLRARDAVDGDVLVVDAAAVADPGQVAGAGKGDAFVAHAGGGGADERSEEHTSELQSLMRLSYAVFRLKQ